MILVSLENVKKYSHVVARGLWGKQCICPAKRRPKLWKSHIVSYLHNAYTYFNDISFSIWFSLKVNSFQWSVLMDVLHIAEFSVPKCEIFCRWISYKPDTALCANFQIFSDTSCENINVFLTETLSVCVYCVSYYSHALLKVLILKPPLKLPCRT